MFQKNFLGVKYLTQNFQKKRHLAVLSQKGPSQPPKSLKLSPSAPGAHPARAFPASPASGEPSVRIRVHPLRRLSNKLENQSQYRIHDRRRKNPLRRTVLV